MLGCNGKNWDSFKVYTISVCYVVYVEFEHFPENEKISSLKYKLNRLEKELSNKQNNEKSNQLEKHTERAPRQQKAQQFKFLLTRSTSTVNATMDETVTEYTDSKGVSITQIQININDATTGLKLQEMSRNKPTIVLWLFIPNWIYVVRPRVCTFKGLFLLMSMPKDGLNEFQVPRELQVFEQQMRRLEHTVLDARERNMEELESDDYVISI